MKKVLISFALLVLGVNVGFAVDRSGNPDTFRSAVGTAAIFRAPTIPSVTSPLVGGTTSGIPTAGAARRYSVDNCMNDMLSCVTNTLPDGINSMFNADMRNSVINGIGLCGTQIDKCVNDAVRVDGERAYYARNDVWVDFNSRVIQPTYYAFVLQKTGLTPNQAENTCWLLDRNVYGPSFSAINASNAVTTEYNRPVTPYNELGGDAVKDEPLGPVVNTTGAVDAQRGHYARWDATTGECLVRIAAYNKGKLITNEWLFGALGDKQPAEMWKSAGESFVCNKDAFGFALRQATQTTALIGMGGGAVVGAGIGAIAGAVNAIDKYEGTISLETDKCGSSKYVGLLNKAANDLGYNKNILNDMDCKDYINMVINPESTGSFISPPTPLAVLTKMNELNEKAIGKGVGTLVGTGVGAGIGLAAGGVATAISAFVEANNISCHVGDGLDKIGFEKKGRVKSLKEYYVQWNLKLPDTVMPQQTVTECNSWNTACGTIVNIADCVIASVLYMPVGATTSTQVANACTVSGNTCVVNTPVAVSYGACL